MVSLELGEWTEGGHLSEQSSSLGHRFAPRTGLPRGGPSTPQCIEILFFCDHAKGYGSSCKHLYPDTWSRYRDIDNSVSVLSIIVPLDFDDIALSTKEEPKVQDFHIYALIDEYCTVMMNCYEPIVVVAKIGLAVEELESIWRYKIPVLYQIHENSVPDYHQTAL